jgi:hypothetical protein
LKAFWKVISPLPVTLKRFLALEFVFTFGIFDNLLRLLPAGGPERTVHLLSLVGKLERKSMEIRLYGKETSPFFLEHCFQSIDNQSQKVHKATIPTVL